jgi:antitoxin MazE
MSTLITIGNSQGIRIPKPIIKQAHLADRELEFVVVKDGLLIKPIEQPSRKIWADDIASIMSQHSREDEALLEELLNDSDLEDTVW